MTTHRRRLRPMLSALEARAMLAGDPFSASWVGQDGNDLVAERFEPGPDQIQDIRFALAGLPADRSIAWAEVQGLGGGSWQHRGAPGTWAVAIVRDARSANADLFVAPYQVETGRPFWITLRYDDGSTASAWAVGGAADPNLRMPSSQARSGWVGQDGRDLVGSGPSVGPDGFQDAHLTLANLSRTDPIASVTVRSSGGAAWAFGPNPNGFADAFFSRHGDDPTRGDLWIGARTDPFGQSLSVEIVYANGKVDVASLAAGHADPGLTQPASAGPLPSVHSGLAASWIGQDGTDLAGRGSARIRLAGLPPGRSVVGAAISDPAGGLWVYRRDAGVSFHGDPWSEPLVVLADADGVDLAFGPTRDEAGSTLTIRALLDDGTTATTRVRAGRTDVALRVEGPSASSVTARPGDDLHDLAARFGSIRLSAGVYSLTRPLALNQPVAIVGEPGATLMFSQAPAEPPWSTAIKVHHGRTTLSGFAVRFATPIRWADGVSYGPAVLGTTDNLDGTGGGLKAGIAIERLDVESPPVPSGSQEAPRLIRMVGALGGRIEGNRLKGGSVEVLGGPWRIVGNTYLGTVPNTYCWAAFAAHNSHDLVLSGNAARPEGPSGRTWRFLVMTGSGFGDLIENNVVVGIGPRDGDTEDPNAAEVVLTEAYSVRFEGRPERVSPDGRIVQIPEPQGGPARSGDAVAILDGPAAGQFRRVAQAIGPRTYLLDAPLPSGTTAISIAPGFVGEAFRGNTIDNRGGGAAGLVLVGNHFGTIVERNHVLGGGQAMKITAAPTERPVAWGWSHAPFLGARIEGNTIEDAALGATFSVEHSAAIKSNAGRVYFSGTLAGNVVAWTDEFLAGRGRAPGLIVGEAGSIDAGESVLSIAGNGSRVPAGSARPTLRIVAANVDGTIVRDDVRTLGDPGPMPRGGPPPSPTGLRLVDDTGLSARDLETADGRVTFDPVAGAVGYEYLVSGDNDFLPLSSAGEFLPANLTPVTNRIWLRAIGSNGERSADAELTFRLDNAPPITSIPFLRPSDDTGVSALDRITRAVNPGFNVTGDVSDTIILLRDGAEVARSLGPGVLIDPSPRPDGTYRYSVRRVDAAGNASDSASVALTIDATAPPTVPGLSASASGVVRFGATAPDDRYEYRLDATGRFEPIGRSTTFQVSGAVLVSVRAVDLAGNVGPVSTVSPGGAGDPSPSGPSGRWVGQDGDDFVGRLAIEPDGLQDVRIELSGLDADRAIAAAVIQVRSGGTWRFGGTRSGWRAALVREPGSSTADLYFRPRTVERGRPFTVTLVYEDGGRTVLRVAGGVANPRLRVVRVAGARRPRAFGFGRG